MFTLSRNPLSLFFFLLFFNEFKFVAWLYLENYLSLFEIKSLFNLCVCQASRTKNLKQTSGI